MHDLVGTRDPVAIELQARSLDALVSLLRALDTSHDVEDVAKRALLTVSGQLLVRRAALYLKEKENLRLRGLIGVTRSRFGLESWVLQSELSDCIQSEEPIVLDLDDPDLPIPREVADNFDRLARLTNRGETIGILMLGGWLGSTKLDDADRLLLRTMGVVIGTTLHRVKIQEELALSHQRLEEAERVRKAVMDHVSHEFNTPLMVIKSVGDMIAEATNEERAELISMHGEATQRLEELVSSILAIGRETDGESASRSVHLRDFVDEVVAPWWICWDCHSGLLDVEPFDTNGVVVVVPEPIETILEELHVNAASARTDPVQCLFTNLFVAPAGWWERSDSLRRLHDRVEWSAQGCEDPDPSTSRPWRPMPSPTESAERELVIEVMDQGRGIPPTELELVFQPFAQATNSPRFGINGAGMGLARARRLADELGGRVVLTSEEGVGTVAALILPIHSA